MSVKQTLQKLKSSLKTSERMPVVFVGHGNPMNAIEDSVYSRSWANLGRTLPKPQAILVVSAHWMTQGDTLVDVSPKPKTIHDFYGFPAKLFAERYRANGNPKLAKEVASLLAEHRVKEDNQWGLDHGAWSILKFLYPKADIPVFQISIDVRKDLDWHLNLGKELSSLRDQGVLILGSGNVVHNLGGLRMNNKPHDWALEFDQQFADKLSRRDFKSLADTDQMGALVDMAHPTLEHYIPTLTIAGASDEKDSLFYTTEGIDLGSLSMRSFVFHGSKM